MVRAVVFADGGQRVRAVLQRRLPINLAPNAALLDHRRFQPIVAVQSLIGKSILVRDPALVQGFNFQRHYPHDFIVLDLDNDV